MISAGVTDARDKIASRLEGYYMEKTSLEKRLGNNYGYGGTQERRENREARLRELKTRLISQTQAELDRF